MVQFHLVIKRMGKSYLESMTLCEEVVINEDDFNVSELRNKSARL